MTSDHLRRIHAERPFSPFVIHLADGRKLLVRHPELLAVSQSGRIAVVFTPDDAVHHLDVLMITELEVKKGKSSNGHQRRRKAG